MKKLFLVLIISCSACIHQGVRQVDLEAWKGVPVLELETQPEYAAMALEVRQLSTPGCELHIYTATGTQTSSTNCYKNSFTHTTTCNGGNTETVQCSHQFTVCAGAVTAYQPVGYCRTDCKRRPASRPCTARGE